MKSTLRLDLEPEMEKVLKPSLVSDETVSYSIETSEMLEIQIETGKLGVMRGSTDTVFRLAMLGNKILQR